MKKVYTYLMMMAMLTVTALTLTSCEDEDADQAYNMNGIWEGTIQGNYYANRFNNNNYDTEIQFVQNGTFSNGGYGLETDYPWDSRRPYIQVGFDWEVRGGRIFLVYDDGYRIIIRDYDLYSVGGRMHFRGYFENYDTGEQLASFDLIKTSDVTDFGYAKRHKADFSEDDMAEDENGE